MSRFLKTFAIFLIIPGTVFCFMLATYVYYDPFRVLREYEAYIEDGKPQYVTPNNCYVTVECFLKNYPKYNYDSFIFGNSRSRFYSIESWNKYIKSSRSMHLDASAESLYGIAKKVEFLDRRNVKIANALIVLDHETLSVVDNSKGHIFAKHPLLSGESWSTFHERFFIAYCSPDFLWAYLSFRFTGEVDPVAVEKRLLSILTISYNAEYHEQRWPVYDSLIANDPDEYYDSKRMSGFYKRPEVEKFSPVIIRDKQVALLESISRTMAHDSTNCRIVINPLYDQRRLAPADLGKLQEIFGKQNVFDFSGVNNLTSDYRNYYETSHFRPFIGDQVLREVYSKGSTGL